MKVRLDLSFKGSRYQGWQRQGHTDNTIQAIIEAMLSKIMDENIRLHASGRTDTGVHAREQVVHFETNKNLDSRNLHFALNRYLPSDISVKNVYVAPEEFHARFSALAKEYRYYCYTGRQKDPFKEETAMFVARPLNISHLNELAACFLGSHDFTALQNTGTEVGSTIREIELCEWLESGEFYEFRVKGSGFLKQMVRNMVGLMLKLHNEEKNTGDLEQIMRLKSKQKSFSPAEAKGLFLHRLYYPAELDKKCRKI